MALGARFQKVRGWGRAEFSGEERGAARFSRATMFFCSNIVINYSYDNVYSNIYDIAESLTQNDHGLI